MVYVCIAHRFLLNLPKFENMIQQNVTKSTVHNFFSFLFSIISSVIFLSFSITDKLLFLFQHHSCCDCEECSASSEGDAGNINCLFVQSDNKLTSFQCKPWTRLLCHTA